ncbi:MAG: hypothetical protein DCC48_17615 [Acidobacteria bacterium]|nr:MAG: hypothetical protein DCC48_17615 [Acidobacteriota bacterium]
MNQPGALARLEAIVDASGIAPRIEAKLPVGGRPRQLRVRTLVLGILLALADARPHTSPASTRHFSPYPSPTRPASGSSPPGATAPMPSPTANWSAPSAS